LGEVEGVAVEGYYWVCSEFCGPSNQLWENMLCMPTTTLPYLFEDSQRLIASVVTPLTAIMKECIAVSMSLRSLDHVNRKADDFSEG